MLFEICKGKRLEKRNPFKLYNSSSLFHRPRITSRQMSTTKLMDAADAVPMMFISIREQKM
jgi:hypothetical protein